MKLTDKYLLREYMIPVTYCVAAFCMIQIVCDLFGQLSHFLKAKASFGLILTYYGYHLATTLEYLLPASLLFATIYTLWQLTRHNELTAMRASGVSLYRIMVPFLTVGVMFSLAGSGVKELISPHAWRTTEDMKRREFGAVDVAPDIRQIGYRHNATGHQWLVQRFSEKKPQYQEGVTIDIPRPNGFSGTRITATRAEYLDGQWWLFDGQIEERNPDGFPTNTIAIPTLGEEMPALSAEPHDMRVAQLPKEVLPTHLSSWQLHRLLQSLPPADTDTRATLATDMHTRLAIPWACLVAVFLGIPAGAQSGRRSALTGIILALSLFVVFWLLNYVGIYLAKKEIIYPWLGAWFSNILFLTAGIIMASRIR